MNEIQQWDSAPQLTWKEKVAWVAYELSLLPQGEAPVEHIFAPGVYIREMTIPKGMLFIGRPHSVGHVIQLVKGSVILIGPEGKFPLTAPYQVQSQPGQNIVCYTVTDVVARTIHMNVLECRDTTLLERTAFDSAQDIIDLGERLHKQVECVA